MAEKEPVEQPARPKSLWQKNRKEICAGTVAAALLVALGAWGFRGMLAPEPQPSGAAAPSVALLDVGRAREAHPDFAELAELQEKEQRLRLALKDTMEPLRAEPPKVEEKPFADSVRQKNAQHFIDTRTEIVRRKKQAAAEYREATEPAYLAKRDEINEKYLNTILNIQLKLENQDILHLTPEAVEALAAQRDELRRERGMLQKELADRWEREIDAHAEDAVLELTEQLDREVQEAKVALEAEAVAKMADAQARDTAAMEQAMRLSMERQQDRARIAMELQQAMQERISLEGHILSDIAGQAAKLAILRHYTMVLASSPETPASRILPLQGWDGNPAPQARAQAIGVAADDITEELQEELKKLQ